MRAHGFGFLKCSIAKSEEDLTGKGLGGQAASGHVAMLKRSGNQEIQGLREVFKRAEAGL